MTCNQLILILDCYRGFDKERHFGTVDKDLILLENKGLIKKVDANPSVGSSFDYEVTNKGRGICKKAMQLS